MAAQAIRRFFAPEHLLKENQKLGPLPDTKTAYTKAYRVAWPSIAETFLFAMVSMADTIMVSSLGDEAIAAVGLASQPRFIVQAIVISLNTALTAVCARRYGEEDHIGASATLKQGMILSLSISLLLNLLISPFLTPFMYFVGANDDTIGLVSAYFGMLLIGLPINNLSMTISSAQRGIGHTKVSMQINITSNLVNLVFNYLLIGGNFGFPAMGVRGAALATVIGWSCGLLVALVSVCRHGSYYSVLSRHGWKFQKKVLESIYYVTSGTFMEQICMRIGFLLQARIVAGLGTTMLAAHHILINIINFSFAFGEGLGIAASSLVGQNLGAKRPDLSIMYGKICHRIALCASSVLFVIFSLFGKYMVMLFTKSPEIIQVSEIIMVILGCIVIAQAGQMVYMGSLRGAGDTRYTAVVSMICIMILRPLLAYTLGYSAGLGLIGVWLAFFTDQVLRLTLTYTRFSSGKWVNIKL